MVCGRWTGGAKRALNDRGWDKLAREESEGTAREHLGGEIVHDRLGLDMQISQHLVGAPAPDEADGVAVDMGAEKGHGARGAKRAG